MPRVYDHVVNSPPNGTTIVMRYAQTDSVTGVTSIHCGVAYGWLTEMDEANALLFAYLF